MAELAGYARGVYLAPARRRRILARSSGVRRLVRVVGTSLTPTRLAPRGRVLVARCVPLFYPQTSVPSVFLTPQHAKTPRGRRLSFPSAPLSSSRSPRWQRGTAAGLGGGGYHDATRKRHTAWSATQPGRPGSLISRAAEGTLLCTLLHPLAPPGCLAGTEDAGNRHREKTTLMCAQNDLEF